MSSKLGVSPEHHHVWPKNQKGEENKGLLVASLRTPSLTFLKVASLDVALKLHFVTVV